MNAPQSGQVVAHSGQPSCDANAPTMAASTPELPPDALETGVTDKTCTVGNLEFLLAVFGDGLTAARPVLVSFEGSPNSVPHRAWIGRPWRGELEEATSLLVSANNYFSLATFRASDAG